MAGLAELRREPWRLFLHPKALGPDIIQQERVSVQWDQPDLKPFLFHTANSQLLSTVQTKMIRFLPSFGESISTSCGSISSVVSCVEHESGGAELNFFVTNEPFSHHTRVTPPLWNHFWNAVRSQARIRQEQEVNKIYFCDKWTLPTTTSSSVVSGRNPKIFQKQIQTFCGRRNTFVTNELFQAPPASRPFQASHFIPPMWWQ